ncbi:hypothetical protein BJX62DRAFT_223981 [Aspergillus germanicus]
MDSAIPAPQNGFRRRRARPSYSCVECTRRKLRCSKHIPCSACVERGLSQTCRRRPEAQASRTAKRRPATVSRVPITPGEYGDGHRRVEDEPLGPTTIDSQLSLHVPVPASAFAAAAAASHAPSSRNNNNTPQRPRNKIVDNVTEDAAVMLEFLALSRRRILEVAQVERQPQPSEIRGGVGVGVEERSEPLVVFTPNQVRSMMRYHQDYIAWIHNAVHLPTFREQCERFFADPAGDQWGLWLGLYYAMLAVTLYHMDPSLLRELDIQQSPHSLAELCYQKSIDSLNEADYMNNHSLFSLQAICLLIYIGHNIGQSDRISVLLACAVRIAQCLCLHRLGLDNNTPRDSTTPDEATILEDMQQRRRLIEREISKRVWWFLVRQDWLQIPFNNTYTIHPTQFNTPMPFNCDEEVAHMFDAQGVVDHEQEHYTQGSYTMVLNHVAVLIWKTQDKLCQQGHPDSVDDGLRRLYSEVIQADRELRELMEKMPSFFRNDLSALSEYQHPNQHQHPAHIRHQHKVLSLALAHKFYSIHRHFQIPSFKEPWFAYTKLSCVPIMRRSLTTILSLPLENSPHTSIVRNMWTVNTQVITTAETEIRDLARRAAAFLHENENQTRSRIAKRGVSLLNTLLAMDRALEMGDYDARFDFRDVVSRVEGYDRCRCSGAGSGSIVDWLSRDAATWEDIMGALDGGTPLSAAWDG